ncbi:DUF11 domain-containing protein [Leucobacter luti]|nr:DUF11 domain-containing protein [Leucobacter luti]MBL3698760.1 DUF11 domain-containing protein [Leucobacter luti]
MTNQRFTQTISSALRSRRWRRAGGGTLRSGAVIAVAAALMLPSLAAPAYAAEGDAAPVAVEAASAAPEAAAPEAAPPEPAPVPEPAVPEPAPAPQPVAPEPVAEPVPEPAPAPESAPEPAAEPAPAAAAEPAPDAAPAADPAAAEDPAAAAAEPAAEASAAARTATTETDKGKDPKVTLCHATASTKNPWVQITIAPDGSANGHAGAGHQSGRDIIPPFSYTVGKQVKQFPGQNWNATGQAIHANGCEQPPQVDPAPTVSLTTGECVADATYPPVSATFGNLVAGQPYRYSVNGGTAVNFTAGSATETKALGAAPGTSVTVQIWGTGTRAASGKVSGAATVQKCVTPLPDVTLCHATSSQTNPWNQITVSPAGALSGHAGASHQSGRDIIPPFEYRQGGATQQFPGQNWDEAGQAIHENGCEEPPPVIDPAPTVALTVGECVADAQLPETTATFSELVAGQSYSYRVNGGTAVTFTAGSGTETRALDVAAAGTITVDVWGTGTRAAPGTVTRSIEVQQCEEPPADVTLCHATSSDTNPWNELALPPAGVLSGHVGSDHQGGRDIIPPFTYQAGGATLQFAGQNWDEAGQAIFENGCEEPPPVIDPTPTVSVTVGDCPVMGGFAPLTVTLGDLVVGQPYRVELAGIAVAQSSPITFTADAPSRTIEVEPSEAGTLSVTVQGTGDHAGESAETTVETSLCPAPEVPELTLSVDQCLAYGAPLPSELTATLEGLLDGVDYTVTIGTSGGGTPYSTRTVHGGESSTEAIQLDIAGAGTYTVTVGVGKGSLTREVTVTPCPRGAYDLSLVKTASAGEAGVAEVGDTIRYTLAVTNAGPDAAQDPVVTDSLPAELTPVPGSESTSAGWSVAFAGNTVTASYSGAFTGEATISFDATVTAAPPSGEVTNTACVAASGPALPQPSVDRVATPAGSPDEGAAAGLESQLVAILAGDVADEGDGGDTAAGNDCGEATTVVRAVAVAGSAVCVNDTPWFTYDITPSGIGDTADLPIVMIWWTVEAYANRDPSIPAGDIAAILADGASQVDPIAYPAGWTSGQQLTGQMLWPGASVDAAGNPTGWPGWTLTSDGTWVLDPAAPHYDLRAEAVVEIRINPTASETTVYPPATPDCAAQPPLTPEPPVTPEPPTTPGAVVPGVAPGPVPAAVAPAASPTAAAPTQLAATGSQGNALGGIGLGLLLLGSLAWGVARHRRETVR